jgi:hypothetical protein
VVTSLDEFGTDGLDLVAGACRLAGERGQSFGVAGLGPSGSDGSGRCKYWNHGRHNAIVS